VYNVVDVHSQFPAVSEWFETLAAHPAFAAGVQKVGLSVSPANSCGSVATNALSDAAKSFLSGKWSRRRNRPRPL